MESYYLGAYWGNRPDSAERCAAKIALLLRLLSSCDEVLARWFTRGRTRREALTREVSSPEDLLAEFRRSESKPRQRGSDGSRYGFRVGLWNGRTDPESGESVGLNVICGQAPPSPRLTLRSCVMDFPSTGPIAERLLSIDKMMQVIQSVVVSLEPEWAVVTSGAFRDLVAPTTNGPFIGWLTYWSTDVSRMPAIPSPSKLVTMGTRGSLIITTEERCVSSDAEHLTIARRLQEVLARGGLLRAPD